VCWQASFNASQGATKNGRCDLATNECVCRTGTIGDACDQAGDLRAVELSGGQFSGEGVPLGELVTVRWNSSGSAELPVVNIVLTKNMTTLPGDELPEGASWSTGRYLATNEPNSGVFEWTVGSGSAAQDAAGALEPGNGYRIVVWFSRNLFAQSDAFTISDPCAYIDCGLNGKCQFGRCNCTTGFEGDRCQTGPCERANCAPDTSTCSNTAVLTTPPDKTGTQQVCQCTGGFTGVQCRTPPNCNIQCANGGDFSTATGVVTPQGCTGTCACKNQWSGPSCQDCGLKCQHGGTASTDCASCSCTDGWTGRLCHCNYVRLKLPLQLNWQLAGLNSDPRALQRFKDTLAVDLQAAVARAALDKTTTGSSGSAAGTAVQAEVAVEDVTFGPGDQDITALVRFGSVCHDITAMTILGAGAMTLTVNAVSFAAADAAPVIPESSSTILHNERFEDASQEAAQSSCLLCSLCCFSLACPFPCSFPVFVHIVAPAVLRPR